MSLVSTRVMVLMDARSAGLRHRWHPRRGLQIFSDASRHGRAKYPMKKGNALCGTVKTYPKRQEVEVTLSPKAPNQLTLDLFFFLPRLGAGLDSLGSHGRGVRRSRIHRWREMLIMGVQNLLIKQLRLTSYPFIGSPAHIPITTH